MPTPLEPVPTRKSHPGRIQSARPLLLIPRRFFDDPSSGTASDFIARRSQTASKMRAGVREVATARNELAPALQTLEKRGATEVAEYSALQQFGEETTGAFSELTGLGVAAASFPDEDRANEVLDPLRDQFEVIPDFGLSLPEKVAANGVPNASVPDASQWPAESGLGKARDDGVFGAGVMIGVLDTGIDADHDSFAGRLIGYRYIPLAPTLFRL